MADTTYGLKLKASVDWGEAFKNVGRELNKNIGGSLRSAEQNFGGIGASLGNNLTKTLQNVRLPVIGRIGNIGGAIGGGGRAGAGAGGGLGGILGGGGALLAIAGLLIIGKLILDLITKIVNLMVQSSPLLQTILGVIQKMFLMIVRPFADIFAVFLMPIFYILKEIAVWLNLILAPVRKAMMAEMKLGGVDMKEAFAIMKAGGNPLNKMNEALSHFTNAGMIGLSGVGKVIFDVLSTVPVLGDILKTIKLIYETLNKIYEIFNVGRLLQSNGGFSTNNMNDVQKTMMNIASPGLNILQYYNLMTHTTQH